MAGSATGSLLELRLEPGVTTGADLSREFDLVLLEYALDLRGVTRLDCEVCDSDGKVYKRVRDIQVRDGRVRGYCDRELAVTSARLLPGGIINRFYAVDGRSERLLGTFHSIATGLPSE